MSFLIFPPCLDLGTTLLQGNQFCRGADGCPVVATVIAISWLWCPNEGQRQTNLYSGLSNLCWLFQNGNRRWDKQVMWASKSQKRERKGEEDLFPSGEWRGPGGKFPLIVSQNTYFPALFQSKLVLHSRASMAIQSFWKLILKMSRLKKNCPLSCLLTNSFKYPAISFKRSKSKLWLIQPTGGNWVWIIDFQRYTASL
jgi:hypothetical protein